MALEWEKVLQCSVGFLNSFYPVMPPGHAKLFKSCGTMFVSSQKLMFTSFQASILLLPWMAIDHHLHRAIFEYATDDILTLMRSEATNGYVCEIYMLASWRHHLLFTLLGQGSAKEGCSMFKVVKNFKMLKRHLKELSWKNGDIFEKVKVLREELKAVQIDIVKNPNDKRLREEERRVLHEYNAEEAMSIIKDVSDVEIKKAMFQINDNKSPGPDWFSSDFYKKIRKLLGKMKGGPKRVNLKIDFQKAYDIVNWSFLEKILKGFGLHNIMVHWVMTCVTTTKFSVYVNRESCGHGDRAFVEMIKETIEEFGSVSGLLPNYHKSTILFRSVKEEDRQSILSVISFRVEKLPVRLEEACTITMNERCSTVLLNKLPSKEKDPGSVTIPCHIGPGEPKPTRMSLELADRILIILGRPFLATARAMIYVFSNKITLRVGDGEVIFDMEQSMKNPPSEDDECYSIDELDDTIHKETQEIIEKDQ
nr:hypothetical protein [Tanacetum cinerariifolium]